MNEVDKVIKEACDAMRRELDGFEQSLRKAREALDVPPPTGVEVGDDVKRKNVWCQPGGKGCKVMGVTETRIALMTNRLTCTCTFPKWHGFKVVRKGPRKHVFEGVELRRRGIYPDDYVAFHGSPDDYKTLNQDKLMAFVDNDKVYRMTLEPMDEE